MIVSKYVNTIETLHLGTPRNPALSPSIVSKRVKHNRPNECGHSQGINFVALILLERNVKHNRNIGCGHSQEYKVGTPSAVSSHRVAGALSPKYHARANVALHGHCADRVALSWSCWPPRESTLFSLMIVSTRVKHNRNVACGHSQEPNFVARHPLELCKIQYNR